MNFKKLQAMQAKLDEAILKEKAPMTAEERFNKTLVALSVEIAEVANTVEHFKFWKDNKGKVDEYKFLRYWNLRGTEIIGYIDTKIKKHGPTGMVSFEQAHRLTLIEECSDALHFILSLANQIDYKIVELGKHFKISKDADSLERKFLFLNYVIGSAEFKHFRTYLEMIIDVFFRYINQLGITPQELEQAYYDKNKVNYERLENGY